MYLLGRKWYEQMGGKIGGRYSCDVILPSENSTQVSTLPHWDSQTEMLAFLVRP